MFIEMHIEQTNSDYTACILIVISEVGVISRL